MLYKSREDCEMSGRQVKLQHAEKGSILYHYTKSNGVNGILTHNCFWATKSDFLNDPNEFSHIQDIIDEVCQENIKTLELREMFLQDSIYAEREKKREYFVLSVIAGTVLLCGQNLLTKPVTTSVFEATTLLQE